MSAKNKCMHFTQYLKIKLALTTSLQIQVVAIRELGIFVF